MQGASSDNRYDRQINTTMSLHIFNIGKMSAKMMHLIGHYPPMTYDVHLLMAKQRVSGLDEMCQFINNNQPARERIDCLCEYDSTIYKSSQWLGVQAGDGGAPHSTGWCI